MTCAAVYTGTFPVGFRSSFKHASKERSVAENVIVQLGERRDPDCGYGEACPRDYVTGETVASVENFIRQFGGEIADEALDRAGLAAWTIAHRDEIDKNPAAYCALEMAKLDRLGRGQRCQVEMLLDEDPQPVHATYSAVIGDSRFHKFAAHALGYRLFGMFDIKLKLSADPKRNVARVSWLKRLFGSRTRLRADANNLWTDAGRAIEQLEPYAPSLWAIEEPLSAGDLDGCREISDALGLRVILDESCTRAGDLQNLAADPARWIVNLRVSKMGGLQRTLDVGRRAGQLGVATIIGAHVGETSLLTRASIAVSRCLPEPPIAMEGAFGTRLIRSDVTDESIMFARRGILLPEHLETFRRPGLGIGVCDLRLQGLEQTNLRNDSRD